jgi:hypothetical protein
MDELESLSHSRWECKYHVGTVINDYCKEYYYELI